MVDNWVMPYDISTHILTGNRLQSVSKLFVAVNACLEIKHSSRTAYYQKTRSEVERFNTPIFTRLTPYFAEDQPTWDQCVQLLTHTHIVQICEWPGTMPVSHFPALSATGRDHRSCAGAIWEGMTILRHLQTFPVDLIARWPSHASWWTQKSRLPRPARSIASTELSNARRNSTLENTSLLTKLWWKWLNRHAWQTDRAWNFCQRPSGPLKWYPNVWYHHKPENGLHNTVLMDKATLASYNKRSNMKLTGKAVNKAWIIADMKTKPAKMTKWTGVILSARRF